MSYSNFLVNKIYIFFFWLTLLIVTSFWPFEEPNKLTTLFNVSIVFFLGLYLIFRYSIAYSDKNVDIWIVVFFTKLLISYFVLFYFIAIPLVPLDKLRTSFQDPMLTDSNFYDFIGLKLKNEGLFDSYLLLFSTWLSFGIIFYVYFIYYFFGVSILYVTLFNSLLTLSASLYLIKTIKTFNINFNPITLSFISFIVLLPYGSYYDLTPNKETLSVFTLSMLYFQLARIHNSKTKMFRNLFFAILLVFIVRPNLGLLVIPIILLILSRKISFFRLALIIFFLFTGVYAFLEMTVGIDTILVSYTNIDNLMENQASNIDVVTSNGSELKGRVLDYLAPNGLVSGVIFFPFRAIIWFFLPFPFVFYDLNIFFKLPDLLLSNWNFYYRIPEQLSRLFSTHLIISSFPFVLMTLIKRISGDRANHLKFFLWFIFLIIVIALSTLNFANGGRYRIVIEPIYFLLVIVGIEFSRIKFRHLFSYYTFYFTLVLFFNILYSFFI